MGGDSDGDCDFAFWRTLPQSRVRGESLELTPMRGRSRDGGGGAPRRVVGVAEPGNVVDDLDQRLREGRLEDNLPIPTGFTPYDEYLRAACTPRICG